MLVASVFGHFMFMTLVLFIPQTVKNEIVIKPALMVKLVEKPTGQPKKKTPPPKKVRKPEPVKRVAEKKQPPKPQPKPPEPKAAKPKFQPKEVTPISESLKFDPLPSATVQTPDASQKIVNQLDQLEGKQKPGLIEELDQLAKLEAQKPKKKTPAPKPPPLQEDKVHEADVAPPKKREPEPKATIPAPPDPLADFEQLKMQSELDPVPQEPVETQETPEKKVSSLKELEFAALERPTLEVKKKQSEKSTVDLLKELDELKAPHPNMHKPSEKPASRPQAALDAKLDSGEVELILKKLDTLEADKQEVQIDVANQKTLAMEFESDIWKVQVPEAEELSAPSVAAVEGGSPIASEGEPDPDILAQYIGLVRQKVYKKWYEPLGRKYNNKEVVVLLTIYSRGNIDRPVIDNSSGVDILDTLAVRAVMEAEPFPPFPEELKYPNLNITIHFKYVPEP